MFLSVINQSARVFSLSYFLELCIAVSNPVYLCIALYTCVSLRIVLYVYIIDQVRGQDGWILAEFSFCVFMDRDEVEVHKNVKRERGQYPAILTELAWSIKDLLYGIKSTKRKWSSYLFFFEHWKGTHLNAKVIAHPPISWLGKCRKYNHLIGYISNSNFKFKFSNSKKTFVFNLPVFAANRSFKSYQHFCFLCFHSRWRFFWFHKDREITKNLFTLAESNFSERKLSWTRLDWRNFICGNETGSPGRAVSLHLARSGSQSKHRIRRILPARGACHIIKSGISLYSCSHGKTKNLHILT